MAPAFDMSFKGQRYLLNVAVSRAKDAFVVVGDAGCLVRGSKSAAGLLKEF